MTHNIHYQKAERERGFTMVELMIALVIVGILLAWAVPNLTSFIQNARMTSIANELQGDIMLARQDALRRGGPVTICASSDGVTCLTGTVDWLGGWIITATNPNDGATSVVKSTTSIDTGGGSRKVTGNGPATIGFSPGGTVSSAAGGPIVITLRDDRAGKGGSTQRDITINLVGRAVIQKVNG